MFGENYETVFIRIFAALSDLVSGRKGALLVGLILYSKSARCVIDEYQKAVVHPKTLQAYLFRGEGMTRLQLNLLRP